MSRTYQALKKAEGEKAQAQVPPSIDGRTVPQFLTDPGPEAQLEYERLRVWITNAGSGGERIQTVMVAACRAQAGATTTAGRLASGLADGRSQVLIVDANFRSPSLARVFGVRNKSGLSDLLENGVSDGVFHTQPTGRNNLLVLTTGRIPHNAADLLERDAMKEFIAAVRSKFAYVVFDAAPVLDFPETCVLARHVDGVALVAEADRTPVKDAQKAARDIERVGGRLLGVVLNRQRDYTPKLLKRFLHAS